MTGKRSPQIKTKSSFVLVFQNRKLKMCAIQHLPISISVLLSSVSGSAYLLNTNNNKYNRHPGTVTQDRQLYIGTINSKSIYRQTALCGKTVHIHSAYKNKHVTTNHSVIWNSVLDLCIHNNNVLPI